MPESHNRHAQSPIRWNCVQLKQHRKWPENDRNWTLPSTPRADKQMSIKTKSATENFPVFPVEIRNQLGVLLEILSYPGWKLTGITSKKTVQSLEIAQKTMKLLQLPKTLNKRV